ncbi:hypothetical protein [Rubrivirga sp.]|uniref:hypothetical protein n=1 Tax=Rubrivirga sp. TaxID=1885344 RepID=UPI003B51A17D
MSDRFSADEAHRIFARAARRQHATPAADGLTAEELAAIGREAGLDPTLVAAEAAAERLAATPEKRWHGVPVAIRRSRLLPDRLSDREWERVVDVLRAEFKQEGTAQQIGRRREWATVVTSWSSKTSASFQVRVEEGPEGDLVTVEAPDTHRPAGYALGGVFAGMGLGLIAMVSVLDPSTLGQAFAFGAMFVVLGVVLYGAMLLAAKLSAARTADRFEALLDRVDLISRLDRPATDPASTGRIDPRLLNADEVSPGEVGASRVRTGTP